MNMDLYTVIEQYKTDKEYKHTLEELLAQEIFEAVKNLKKAYAKLKGNRTITFYLKSDKNPPYPDKVQYQDIIKDFWEVFDHLLDKFIKMIDEGNDISVWKQDKDKRKNFIRSWLGFKLHNCVFKLQIKKKNKFIFKSIDEPPKDDEGNALPTPLDKQIAKEYFDIDPIPLSTEEYNNNIQDQKEAFFWIPGNTFKNKHLTGDRSKRAVYIGYFYAWLRNKSGAEFKEIAKEIGVDRSAFNRWTPHFMLEQPFQKETNFISVYFDKPARDNIGLSDDNIRCYRGKCLNNSYEPVKNIKENLWKLYDFLRNDLLMNFIENNPHDYNENDRLKNQNFPFTFEPTIKEAIKEEIDIGECEREKIIFIKSMEN